MSPTPALPPSRRPVFATHFGRVSVGVQGRVMMSVAEGPFDAELMAATKRAIALAGKRLPADRRVGDLLEIRGSLQMDADALAALREEIFYVSITQSEPGVEPYCVADNFRRKTIALEGNILHPRTLLQGRRQRPAELM